MICVTLISPKHRKEKEQLLCSLTGFLPQDLDDNFAKFLHAHRFSGVGMCQEGLIRFWLALDLRASDHTHERDQIIGRCGC